MKRLICLFGWLPLACSQAPHPPASSTPARYAHQEEHAAKIDDQIKEMESRVHANPVDWVSLALLSKLYLEKGEESPADYTRAEQAALLSLSIRPARNSEALLALAAVRYQQGDFPAVVKICRQFPNALDSPRLAALALVAQGKIREAAEWSAVALKRQNDTHSLTLAAHVSVAGGRDDIAEKLLEAARKLEQPGERAVSAELRTLWGDLLRRHGKIKEAREMLESSLTIQRRNIPALRALARLELDQGSREAALESYRQAEALTHGPRLLVEVAALDPEHAPDLLEKADPQLKGAQRAPLLLLQKKPQEALKLLKQQEKTGADWHNYQLQAQAFEQLKQPQKALDAYQKGLAQGFLDPLLLKPALQLARDQKDRRAADFELKLKTLH
ncbi:MAG: hypothetical protein KF760_17975 [Candidatus Eremiobacteraeota bacterium]|nr:hypothetical protein [Candidatus Eremiobacteraeota bacterium]MCW5871217.1 hypothetical protein [Candidatus Eremiobacteraeota bacterium]